MEKWKKWHNILKHQTEDLRLEVVLSELIKSDQIGEDDFFVLPNGGFHRIVSQDIEEMRTPGTTTRKTERALIEINRPGIYDGLPESLFHQSRKSKPFKSISAIKEEITYHNEVERKARLFFAPLDHELIATRCLVEINERRMTTDMLDTKEKSGLKKFWAIPDFFTSEEQGKLMLLLPLSYRLSSDLDAAAEALSILLDTELSIGQSQSENMMAEAPLMSLGGSQLGIHTVTQMTGPPEDLNLKISLGPMSREAAATYALAQLGYRKLSYLADYFIPADMTYVVEVLLAEDEQVMKLDVEGDLSRLGVTTYLN